MGSLAASLHPDRDPVRDAPLPPLPDLLPSFSSELGSGLVVVNFFWLGFPLVAFHPSSFNLSWFSLSHTELESIQEVLSDYRQCHSALIQWIEEITAQQELMKPGQAEDSRVLSEQLSQQTVRQDLVTSRCRRDRVTSFHL